MNLRHLGRRIGRWLFHGLYHGWAWAYDAVAAVVSLGRWYDWVMSVQPFIVGPRVLEIGPGTGHLLEALIASEGLRVYALDESQQMLHLARRRNAGKLPLVRGRAQNLPIKSATFDTIVSTFPADFIRDAQAISELDRALRPGGRLVVLPAAQIVGAGPWERLMAWALALVGEAPRDSRGVVSTMILPPLRHAGLEVELHELMPPASVVFVIVSTKPAPPA
jgi:ubiquinone/menaquinone biosynthesis C-methylase UbiE